jgi:quercetin dioxygenase-like cupin family protein
MLIQHDLPIPGYTAGIAAVEVPPGGREGRHTHPGPLYVYVQEGAITVETDGQPTRTYKAGDTFFIEGGKIHEGINYGTATYRSLTSFVVPKGKPLTSQVP